MDWFLMVSTLLCNASLGISGRKWQTWLIHSLNSCIWLVYSYYIGQTGFIALSVAIITLNTYIMILILQGKNIENFYSDSYNKLKNSLTSLFD